jgi:hypothetical protein
MPTPAAVTAVTAADALNTGVAVIQMFGVFAFITFSGFVGAAVMLYKRVKSASR